MIDLERLAKPAAACVPVRNRSFWYRNKLYKVDGDVEDSWYSVELAGNNVKILEKDPCLNIKGVQGYTYNNSFIFQNFDVAWRKWGFKIQKPLHFNTLETFSAARAVVWEDNEAYLLEPDYSDCGIMDIKDCFDEDKPLAELKGVTPELRTLFLFHSIERDHLEALLAEKVAKEEHEKRMKEIPYRLKHTLERAGAQLERYSVSGDRIIVDWTIPGNRHRYNSVINKTTWMVEEAGYCLNDGDKKLNLTSLVKTADEFEQDGLTYITRRS